MLSKVTRGSTRNSAAVWIFLVLGPLILFAIVAYPASEATKKLIKVTVVAGASSRIETVVTFDLPEVKKEKLYGLRDESGGLLPLQVEGTEATFVLPQLAAGKSKSYRVVEVARRFYGSAQSSHDRNGLKLEVGGRPVLNFVTVPLPVPSSEVKPVFLRAGYMHPVYAPSGRIVTDDYPSDHYHHHGIWFAWTKTEFEGGHPDFWNVRDGTGRVEFEALDHEWSGPVHAGFRSRQRYVSLTGPKPKTALNEVWEVRVFTLGKTRKPYFMFDLVVTQQCATTNGLGLDEYRYGGMALRGHHDWRDKSKVSFLTSEGKTREDGDATRARWCHIGGPVDGQLVGIAVLDHPGNFRAPTPLRIHPSDPYFNYAPSQLGKFEMKPGEKYTVRYRYIVADGRPDRLELDRLWNDYAHPPKVKVTLN